MNDRFKFNAVVSSYYDIDTPEEYKEVEPQFYLKNVDVFCTGEIGVNYDTLLEAIREQSKDLTEIEISKIMQHFEDNSNSPDCDFVTITPDKIIQCTGLKDKNGKLIYEGDIVRLLEWQEGDGDLPATFETDKLVVEYKKSYAGFFPMCVYDCDCEIYNNPEDMEVIGNIYTDAHLLEECE